MSRLNRSFPARLGAFDEIRMLIEEFSGLARLDSEDRHKLTLIVEELFTNTVTHGFRGDSDSLVILTLEDTENGVRLTYEDGAPRHDPIRTGMRTDVDAAARTRQVGGIGVAIALLMTRDARYDYVDGRNRVSLTYRRKA